MTPPEPPFPCPFCRSPRVTLVGGGLVFLHYKCAECAEVWTAMAAPRPSVLRPTTAASSASPSLPMFGDFDAGETPGRCGTRAEEADAVIGFPDDPGWPEQGGRTGKIWRH